MQRATSATKTTVGLVSINSRQKGARSEREFASKLREEGWDTCTIRGCQNAGRGAGGTAAPDVICEDLSAFHIEVKNRQKGSTREGYEQASRDAEPNQMPVYAFKKNNAPWLICLSLEDFMKITRELDEEFRKRDDRSNNTK